MEKNIAVIQGDGIGPEITTEAIKVLEAVAKIRGHKFNYRYADMGGVAFDKATSGMSAEEKKAIDDWEDEDKRKLSLPQEALDAMDWARDSEGAVLFGSVGRNDLPKRVAELGLLGMRARYDVANNRPFIIDPILAHNSILFRKPVKMDMGIEFVSPEESLFNGYPYMGEDCCSTVKGFSRAKLEKTVIEAFEKAKETGQRIMCASKYNVLVSEKMLSEVFNEAAEEYEGKVRFNTSTNWQKDDEATLRFVRGYDRETQRKMLETGKVPTGQLIIDNAGMQIASNPERYDNTIVVADAMFGDFLKTIVDVVSGSTPVNEDAKREIKE